MELADDIAYGVHDLEDAIGLGLIRHQTFCEWYEKTDEDSKKTRKALIQPFLDVHHGGQFDDFAKNLFNSGTQARKRVIGHLVGFFVERTKLVRQNEPAFADDIFAFQAVFDKEIEEALRTLKEIVVELVIKSTPVQQLEFKGQKIVADLFAVFACLLYTSPSPRDRG